MRNIIIGLGILILFFGGFFVFKNLKSSPKLTPVPLFVEETASGSALYQNTGTVKASVKLISESVPMLTQIEITPDGNTMLVGTLPGKIFAFQKQDGAWKKQIEPFFDLPTSQPGWPPEEAGLTGIVFSADFETSHDIFLNYSFAFEKSSFRNRVTRITFSKDGDKIVGKDAKQIFEANAPGTGSHQIQDGVGIMISGKPYELFTLGEGFVAKRALDPKQEAGKVMIIDRDGQAPPGKRPFADNPKIQAIGIRNAPAIALNPKNNFVAVGDTGPNNFDRFIYGAFFDKDGGNDKLLSFNWDETEASLQKPALDLYQTGKLEMILKRWAPTETAVNIAFYENEKLPKLAENQQYVLVTLFGRTGEKENKPGKSIMLGILTHAKANKLELSSFIERAALGEGKLGHPLGLTVDPQTKKIYFGDILEGRIYEIDIL